LTRMEAV